MYAANPLGKLLVGPLHLRPVAIRATGNTVGKLIPDGVVYSVDPIVGVGSARRVPSPSSSICFLNAEWGTAAIVAWRRCEGEEFLFRKRKGESALLGPSFIRAAYDCLRCRLLSEGTPTATSDAAHEVFTAHQFFGTAIATYIPHCPGSATTAGPLAEHGEFAEASANWDRFGKTFDDTLPAKASTALGMAANQAITGHELFFTAIASHVVSRTLANSAWSPLEND